MAKSLQTLDRIDELALFAFPVCKENPESNLIIRSNNYYEILFIYKDGV